MKDKLLINWNDVERDTIFIAKEIRNRNLDYKGIVVVARGGLAVASIICRLLNIKILDVVSIGLYNELNNITEIKILKYPEIAIIDKGKGWLIVDDLIDSCKTYNKMISLLPKADFACLYNKSDFTSFKNNTIYAKKHDKNRWIQFPWELEIIKK